MKRLLGGISVLLLVVLLAGCDYDWERQMTGSGNVAVEEKDLRDFTRVDVASAFEVKITRGDSYGTRIIVDDDLSRHVVVRKEGDTLKIHLDGYPRFSLGHHTLRAEITMPDLQGLTLSGATRATVSGFESTHDFDLHISGASRLEGDIVARNARFNISGAGRAALQGSANQLTLDASGASHLDLEDFELDRADVKLSGTSRADLNVKTTLDRVRLSGASALGYQGNPTIGSINITTASSIHRKS